MRIDNHWHESHKNLKACPKYKSRYEQLSLFDSITDESKYRDRLFSYIFAGKARFSITLVKDITVSYSYKVYKCKADGVYKLSYLDSIGPKWTDYKWTDIGYWYEKDKAFQFNDKDALYAKLLGQLFLMVHELGCYWDKTRFIFNKSNYCPVCGRLLNSNKSKELGYGKACYKKLIKSINDGGYKKLINSINEGGYMK